MMSLSRWNPSDAVRALGQVDQAYDMEAKEYIDDFEFAQDKANWFGHGVRGPIGIYCHSGGNYYMHPIAYCLQRAFLAAGTECLLLSERDETSEITLPIVVAP